MSKRKMMRFERGVPVGQLINEDYMNNHDEWKGVVYQTNDINPMHRESVTNLC